nr:smad nuclear-interacting protein 1 [Quercus suber]
MIWSAPGLSIVEMDMPAHRGVYNGVSGSMTTGERSCVSISGRPLKHGCIHWNRPRHGRSSREPHGGNSGEIEVSRESLKSNGTTMRRRRNVEGWFERQSLKLQLSVEPRKVTESNIIYIVGTAWRTWRRCPYTREVVSSPKMPRSPVSRDRSVSEDHEKYPRDHQEGSGYDERYEKRGSNQEEYSRRSERHGPEDRHQNRDRQHSRHRSYRDYDKNERSSRKHRSRSPDHARHNRHAYSSPVKRRRDSFSNPRSPVRRSRVPLPSQNEMMHGVKDGDRAGAAPIVKEKPNYKPTGLLAKEANTVAGTTTVLKYHEPPEARKPPAKQPWRMYVFKQQDLVDTIYIHQRSVWLIGRDKLITDMLLEHPSISKQHAVIQFRHINSTNEYGDKTSKVKPYLLDLESANGTKLNGKAVEASRYIELVDADMIQFGDSEREYVLMLPPTE